MTLCSEKAIKDPLDILWVDSRSRVLHRNDYVLRQITFCFEMQEPRIRIDGSHRLNAIIYQIKHDLLQLNSISHDLWNGLIQRSPHGNVMTLQFGFSERQHLPN